MSMLKLLTSETTMRPIHHQLVIARNDI
uniref:Uncharacterized protein n=1 Tax=Tetranychus urticae TaxID=32264 RepID=T1JSM7_TETUR